MPLLKICRNWVLELSRARRRRAAAVFCCTFELLQVFRSECSVLVLDRMHRFSVDTYGSQVTSMPIVITSMQQRIETQSIKPV